MGQYLNGRLRVNSDAGLIFALVLLGFTFVIAQVLLIRELIVTFYGNELTLGIIFFNWLIMVATGAFMSRRLVLRLGRIHLSIIQILISILLLTQLFLARVTKGLLVVEHGAILGIIPIFLSSAIILAPLCMPIGFQFTLGCKVYARSKKATEVGEVYIYEALGSLIGGCAFAYLFIHYLQPFQIAAFVTLLNLVSAFILQFPYKSKLLSLTLVTLLVIGAYALPSVSMDLEKVSSRLQWRDYDLIHYKNSIYGNVALTKTDTQLNFYESGLLMFVAPDPNIVHLEEKIHLPLLLHSMPKKVLLIGGGIGGALDEILKHRVSEVYYVELDPLIVQVGKEHIPSFALDDPRIIVEHLDGRLFVNRAEEKFDIVIINLPPPSTLQLNRFYSLEFFKDVRRILKDDGILSIEVPSTEAYLSKEMRDHNGCVYITLRKVFPSILVIPGEFTFFLASPSEIRYNTETMVQRLQESGIVTKVLNEPYIQYKSEKIGSGFGLYENQLEVNRDIRPIGTYYNMVLWNVMFYPNAAAFFNLISQASLWFIILGISVLLVFISMRRKSAETPISTITMTSGFAAMTINITLIFAFQAAYGYIYQTIAVLVASFMMGLSIGAYSINKMMGRIKRPIDALAGIVLGICAYSLLLIPILSSLLSPNARTPTEMTYFILNGLVGFLNGLIFPLATKAYLKESDRISVVAGKLYAFDLIGACIGAILTGVFLVPVLGIPQTCLMVFALNLIGFILLISVRKTT